MPKPKVAHLFSAPQSAFYFLEGQLQYLKKNGFEVHLLIPKDNYFSNKIFEREKGIFIHYIQINRKISPLSDIISIFSLINKFSYIKPDIIHLHTPKASLLGMIAGRLTRINHIIYHMHGLVSTWGNQIRTKSLLYWIERFTCSGAHSILAVSSSLRDFAIANKFCVPEKILVLENGTINGIDFSNRFNPEKIKDKNRYLTNIKKSGCVILGFIGRLNVDKGIPDFFYVANKLKEKSVNFIAVIVGPNESDGLIEKMIRGSQLKINEDLLLFPSIDDPQNIICDFDILLLPSVREGFGLVAAEANSLGVPVVAYNIPGIRDAIMNNETGFLVPFNERDMLVEKVLEYIGDPELRQKHGYLGRKRVASLFDRESIWRALLSYYKDIISQKQK